MVEEEHRLGVNQGHANLVAPIDVEMGINGRMVEGVVRELVGERTQLGGLLTRPILAAAGEDSAISQHGKARVNACIGATVGRRLDPSSGGTVEEVKVVVTRDCDTRTSQKATQTVVRVELQDQH